MNNSKKIFMIDWNMFEHVNFASAFIERGFKIVGYVFWEKELHYKDLERFSNHTYIKEASSLFKTIEKDIDYTIAPSKNVFDEIQKHKGTCLLMMDRVGGYGLKAQMKDKIISDFTFYWNQVFSKTKPDVVIYPDTPHMLYDYISLIVAKALGIKTLIQEVTYIPDTFYLTGNVAGLPTRTTLEKKELSSKYSEFLSYKLNELSKGSSYLIKEDKRLARQQIRPKHSQNILHIISLFRQYFKRKILTGNPTRYALIKPPSQLQELVNSLKNYSNIQKCRAIYEIFQSSELPEKYLYYPLHFQPEKTTCPMGDPYTNQINVIRTLASALPQSWKLLVKEHPYQFSLRALNYLARDVDYYRSIKDIPRVVFAPMNFEGRYLISKCEAVAVITGTAGFEGIIGNKKVITFSTPWYSTHPDVHVYSSHEELKKFLIGDLKPTMSLEDFMKNLNISLIDGTFAFDMYRKQTMMGVKKTIQSYIDEVERQVSS